MKIAVFPKTSAIAGRPVMKAFIESLQGEDYVICENHERPEADVVVMWSWLLGMYGRDAIYNHYKRTHAKFLILEVGALRRNTSWKLAINGINRDANFGNQSVDDKRLNLFNLQTQPWQDGGDHIIICGQNEKSLAWDQGNTIDWASTVIEWIRRHTDRPIWFRPHPRFPVSFAENKSNNVHVSVPKKVQGYDEVDFTSALKNAYAVINYNSNPAIESVLSGVPVYVAESSLCYPVGNKIFANLDRPAKPDRSDWLKQISYTEWFVQEISQGIPWRRLRANLTNG
jgi:hypothetical protein